MLQIQNATPFETGIALLHDCEGRNLLSVAAKATLTVPARDGAICEVASTQLPVLPAPEYRGEPGASSILYPQDLVLQKRTTDIVFVGSVHAPGGKAARQVDAALEVGEYRKLIRAVGDRHWLAELGGFAMTDPLPFETMPVTYERAFGGVDASEQRAGNGAAHDERNPVGVGYCLHRGSVEVTKLPNIENPQASITAWDQKPSPAGLGAVDASWSRRRAFAGTYDQAWQDDQFPLPPADLRPEFFDAGAEGLVAREYLEGGEPVHLYHLAPTEHLRFRLPRIGIHFTMHLAGKRRHVQAPLWTLLLEPDEGRFYFVWGAVFDVGKQPSQCTHVEVEMQIEPGTLMGYEQ